MEDGTLGFGSYSFRRQCKLYHVNGQNKECWHLGIGKNRKCRVLYLSEAMQKLSFESWITQWMFGRNTYSCICWFLHFTHTSLIDLVAGYKTITIFDMFVKRNGVPQKQLLGTNLFQLLLHTSKITESFEILPHYPQPSEQREWTCSWQSPFWS